MFGGSEITPWGSAASTREQAFTLHTRVVMCCKEGKNTDNVGNKMQGENQIEKQFVAFAGITPTQ
jgi:hypothetical protein